MFTMSPTTIAPDPTATATVAFAPDDLLMQDQPADVTSDGVVEREELRLEFEAIIAAGYRGGADEPRPAPPSPRVAVIVGGRRPVVRPTAPIGTGRPVRPRPAPTVGPAPRERGPPAPGPHGCCALRRGFPCNSNVRTASPRDRRRRHRVDRGPGRAARASVATVLPPQAGAPVPHPHRARTAH